MSGSFSPVSSTFLFLQRLQRIYGTIFAIAVGLFVRLVVTVGMDAGARMW